jgi:hypothetical protein
MKKILFRPLTSFLFFVLFGFLMLPSSATSAGKVFKQVWKNDQVYGQEQRFSDDGTKIIVIYYGSSINYIYVLDALNGKILYYTSAIGNGTISHDGKYLAVMLPSSSVTSPTILLYDTQNFGLYKEIPLPYSYKSYKNQKVFFSADDKELYTSVFILDTSGSTPYPYGNGKLLVLNIESLKLTEIELGHETRFDSLLTSKDGKYYVVLTEQHDDSYYQAPYLLTTVYDAKTHKALYGLTMSWYEYNGYIDERYTSTPFHLSDDNKLYVKCKEDIRDNYGDIIGRTHHIKVFDLDAEGKLVNECKKDDDFGSKVSFLDNDNYIFILGSNEEQGFNYRIYDFSNCSVLEDFWTPLYLLDYHNGYYLADTTKSIGDGVTEVNIGVYTIDSTGSVSSYSAIVSNFFVDKEFLRFTLFLPSFSHCLIKIFDNSGKELCIVAEGDYVGENVFSYNIQNLPAGVYFLRVNDKSFKFIIAR